MAKGEESWKRICYIVGLHVGFLTQFDFENFPEDIQNHLPIEDWICNFLRQKYKKIFRDRKQVTPTEVEILTSLGFRPDSAAIKTICARASYFQKHVRLIECAEIFIRDEIKYNSILCGTSCSRFPLNLTRPNEWFALPEARSRKDTVQPCSLINLEDTEQIQTKILQLPPDETEDRILLFHGTDHDSALSISDQGIDINEGSQKRDFSDGAGFYLTDDLNHATRMARGKTSKPAVLVYALPKDMRTKFSGLSLCDEKKREEWKTVVSQFRSGRTKKNLRKSLENADFIEGPISSSYELPPVAKEGSYQMCAISDDLADEIDKCLRAIAFFDTTAA